MRHFVQYHSVRKMGAPPPDFFRVFTDKPIADDVIGERVWLVVGDEGRYSLHSTFIAERLNEPPPPGFATVISASTGRAFDPPIPIDDEYWFEELRRLTGNFAFGFTPLSGANGVVGGLRTLASV